MNKKSRYNLTAMAKVCCKPDSNETLSKNNLIAALG